MTRHGEWRGTLQGLVDSGMLTVGDGYRTRVDQLSPGGIPILRAADIQTGYVRRSIADAINLTYLPKIGPKVSAAEDVVITTKGTVGRSALIPQGFEKHAYSPQLCYLRVSDRSRLSPRYLYCWVRSPSFRMQLDSHKGLTDMAPYVNLKDLKSFELIVPPLEVQERIAGALGAFDDLIETNRRLAGKMRDAAQWAARRALAGRARTVPLTDIVTVGKGFSYKSAELEGDEMVLLNLKNAGRGGHFRRDGYKPLSTTRHKPGHVVQAGDVIVAMTDLTQDRDIIARPLRVQAPAAQVAIVASLDLAVLRPRGRGTREFIWAVLSDPEFRRHALGYCSGTTVLHMKGTAFSDYLVPEVDEQLITHLGVAVEPLISGADEVDLESDALAAQRDELLPLLMSGRVRVRDMAAASS